MKTPPFIRPLLLTLYFLAAFGLFLLVLLPAERVKNRLEREVQSRTPLVLTVSRLSPRFFDRFALHDVVLADRSGRVLFECDEARATVSLTGFLRGRLDADVLAGAYGGVVTFRLLQGKDRQSMRADAADLDLTAYRLLRDLGLKLTGTLGGSVEVTDGVASGKLWVKRLGTRGAAVKGFQLPDLDFEQGWLEAELRGDRLQVRKFDLDGRELSVRVSGDLVLREQGPLTLQVRLKPSERLSREQSALLSFLKERDPEGFYRFSVGGTLNAPVPRL